MGKKKQTLDMLTDNEVNKILALSKHIGQELSRLGLSVNEGIFCQDSQKLLLPFTSNKTEFSLGYNPKNGLSVEAPCGTVIYSTTGKLPSNAMPHMIRIQKAAQGYQPQL